MHTGVEKILLRGRSQLLLILNKCEPHGAVAVGPPALVLLLLLGRREFDLLACTGIDARQNGASSHGHELQSMPLGEPLGGVVG